MNEYVDAEEIVTMAREGRIEILDGSFAAVANQFLEEHFPLRSWSTIVDWDRLPFISLAWNCATNDQAVEWARSTTAANCEYALLLFNPTQRCLIGPLEFMVRHLDELVAHAPGCRILLAVDRSENGNLVFGGGIIEFNGKGELYAIPRN